MAKLKALLPALREKKRYVVFEALSKNRISGFASLAGAIWQGLLSFAGVIGAAHAGLQVMPEKYNAEAQKGIARVSHNNVGLLKASFVLIQAIDNVPAVIRSIGVSGSLKKATKLLAG